MKKTRYILIAAIVAFAQSTFKAQDTKDLVSLQYAASFGIGDLNKFISAPSWRGINFDYRKVVEDVVGIGFEVAWNSFYEKKDYATYTKDTRSITGTQYRYVNAVPMMASFNYYLSPDQQITPYAGLGIGTLYSENYVNMGLYTLSENAWHFLLKPEIGVNFNLNEAFALTMVAKYYVAFKTEDVGARNYISTNIGFTWKL